MDTYARASHCVRTSSTHPGESPDTLSLAFHPLPTHCPETRAFALSQMLRRASQPVHARLAPNHGGRLRGGWRRRARRGRHAHHLDRRHRLRADGAAQPHAPRAGRRPHRHRRRQLLQRLHLRHDDATEQTAIFAATAAPRLAQVRAGHHGHERGGARVALLAHARAAAAQAQRQVQRVPRRQQQGPLHRLYPTESPREVRARPPPGFNAIEASSRSYVG
eukprot:6177738-Pleurochrysis_carterae.AAC.1